MNDVARFRKAAYTKDLLSSVGKKYSFHILDRTKLTSGHFAFHIIDRTKLTLHVLPTGSEALAYCTTSSWNPCVSDNSTYDDAGVV
jgi:hypothetical protein